MTQSVKQVSVETGSLKRAVRRAARGDGRAAEGLFDLYYPRVYGYAIAKLRDPVAAEDVAAETFARVLGTLNRFRWRGGGFEPWLFRIAANLVVDHIRLSGRERAHDTITAEMERPVGWGPEDVAVRGEVRREIHALLDDLPEDQRDVLLLRFVADLDTAEVSRVMGRPANAVRQLQFRALANLRKRMHSQEIGS